MFSTLFKRDKKGSNDNNEGGNNGRSSEGGGRKSRRRTTTTSSEVVDSGHHPASSSTQSPQQKKSKKEDKSTSQSGKSSSTSRLGLAAPILPPAPPPLPPGHPLLALKEERRRREQQQQQEQLHQQMHGQAHQHMSRRLQHALQSRGDVDIENIPPHPHHQHQPPLPPLSNEVERIEPLALFEWIDARGRTTSPPRIGGRRKSSLTKGNLPTRLSSSSSNQQLASLATSSRPIATTSAEDSSSLDETKLVEVVIGPGQILGLTLRGGSQLHGLGVYVSSAERGSAAEKAGIRIGDQILSLNGCPWIERVKSSVKTRGEEGGNQRRPSSTSLVKEEIGVMTLEDAVTSICKAASSCAIPVLCFRIRSTGKVPSSILLRTGSFSGSRTSGGRGGGSGDRFGGGTRSPTTLSPNSSFRIKRTASTRLPASTSTGQQTSSSNRTAAYLPGYPASSSPTPAHLDDRGGDSPPAVEQSVSGFYGARKKSLIPSCDVLIGGGDVFMAEQQGGRRSPSPIGGKRALMRRKSSVTVVPQDDDDEAMGSRTSRSPSTSPLRQLQQFRERYYWQQQQQQQQQLQQQNLVLHRTISSPPTTSGVGGPAVPLQSGDDGVMEEKADVRLPIQGHSSNLLHRQSHNLVMMHPQMHQQQQPLAGGGGLEGKPPLYPRSMQQQQQQPQQMAGMVADYLVDMPSDHSQGGSSEEVNFHRQLSEQRELERRLSSTPEFNSSTGAIAGSWGQHLEGLHQQMRGAGGRQSVSASNLNYSGVAGQFHQYHQTMGDGMGGSHGNLIGGGGFLGGTTATSGERGGSSGNLDPMTLDDVSREMSSPGGRTRREEEEEFPFGGRRCASLRIPSTSSGSGHHQGSSSHQTTGSVKKRYLPSIPLTSSDLALNPRRQSVIAAAATGGGSIVTRTSNSSLHRHILPTPPTTTGEQQGRMEIITGQQLKNEQANQRRRRSDMMLQLKRHSTSSFERQVNEMRENGNQQHEHHHLSQGSLVQQPVTTIDQLMTVGGTTGEIRRHSSFLPPTATTPVTPIGCPAFPGFFPPQGVTGSVGGTTTTRSPPLPPANKAPSSSSFPLPPANLQVPDINIRRSSVDLRMEQEELEERRRKKHEKRERKKQQQLIGGGTLTTLEGKERRRSSSSSSYRLMTPLQVLDLDGGEDDDSSTLSQDSTSSPVVGQQDVNLAPSGGGGLHVPIGGRLGGRRGSGNHLMIPDGDSAPLYLVLPQVQDSNEIRISSFSGSSTTTTLKDIRGGSGGTTRQPITTVVHARVRRHRSLPSPFIACIQKSGGEGGQQLQWMGGSTADPSFGGIIGDDTSRRPSSSSSIVIGPCDSASRRESMVSGGGGTTSRTPSPSQQHNGMMMTSDQQQHALYDSPTGQPRRSGSFRRPNHRVTHEQGGRLRVHIKKDRPYLGIAFEGGDDVPGMRLPRIINLLSTGSAFESGSVDVGHVILEVDCISTKGLRHADVACMMADAYYRTPGKNFVELLVVPGPPSSSSPNGGSYNGQKWRQFYAAMGLLDFNYHAGVGGTKERDFSVENGNNNKRGKRGHHNQQNRSRGFGGRGKGGKSRVSPSPSSSSYLVLPANIRHTLRNLLHFGGGTRRGNGGGGGFPV